MTVEFIYRGIKISYLACLAWLGEWRSIGIQDSVTQFKVMSFDPISLRNTWLVKHVARGSDGQNGVSWSPQELSLLAAQILCSDLNRQWKALGKCLLILSKVTEIPTKDIMSLNKSFDKEVLNLAYDRFMLRRNAPTVEAIHSITLMSCWQKNRRHDTSKPLKLLFKLFNRKEFSLLNGELLFPGDCSAIANLKIVIFKFCLQWLPFLQLLKEARQNISF